MERPGEPCPKVHGETIQSGCDTAEFPGHAHFGMCPVVDGDGATRGLGLRAQPSDDGGRALGECDLALVVEGPEGHHRLIAGGGVVLAVADHPGLPHRGLQPLEGLLPAVLGDLRVIVVEEGRIPGIQVGQRTRRRDPHPSQHLPLAGVETAAGDRRRGVLGTHLIGAPQLVRAQPAFLLADRNHQRLRVIGGPGDQGGGRSDLHPEVVFVVVAFQHRPHGLASAAGERGPRRGGQVVPDEDWFVLAARHRHGAGADDRPEQPVGSRVEAAGLQHPGVVRQLQAVFVVMRGRGAPGQLPPDVGPHQGGHRLGRLLGGAQGFVVLDVSGQIAATDLDEHVRPALAPAGSVIRQPPAQDEWRPGLHGRQRFRDRRGLAQAGINQLRGIGVQSDQFGEHLGFELPAGVEEGLQFCRGHPLRNRNQGREVVVGAHRTLLGGITAQQDGLCRTGARHILSMTKGHDMAGLAAADRVE